MKLSEYQKKCLKELISHFEKRPDSVSFNLKPKRLYRLYDDPFGDIDEKEMLEAELREMEANGLIRLTSDGSRIRTIQAAAVNMPRYYKLLHITPLSVRQKSSADELDQLLGKCDVTDLYLADCREKSMRSAKCNIIAIQDHVCILASLYEDHPDILEREFSNFLFGNTKKVEQTYRTSVRKIVCKYDEDKNELIEETMPDSEKDRIIWESFGVFRSPSFVYIEGEGEIILSDGRKITLWQDFPTSVSSEMMPLITELNLSAETLISIENLASFSTMPIENEAKIYLGGYPTYARCRLLTIIHQSNPGITNWLHAGDIDPDGYNILRVLRQKTGIPFEAYLMNPALVKEYSMYCKKLTEHDKALAERMIAEKEYSNEMLQLVSSGMKLEQENIIYQLKNKTVTRCL